MQIKNIFHKAKQVSAKNVFITLGIVLIASHIIAYGLHVSRPQEMSLPPGFDYYTFTENEMVFRIIFPIYERNPNSSDSLYEDYLATKKMTDSKFEIFTNEIDTGKAILKSHQARKIFDYEDFTEPRVAMYSFYTSTPKDGLSQTTADELIELAKYEAATAGSELEDYRILNYKGTIAIEYEYNLMLDNLPMTSRHLTFVNNQTLIDLSVVRSTYLSKDEVFWYQFINSLEFTDSDTASLILGTDVQNK